MVARKFQVRHNDADFVVDYDTDDGFEVLHFSLSLSLSLKTLSVSLSKIVNCCCFLQTLKFQLFSLTSVVPDDQKVLSLSLSLSLRVCVCVYIYIYIYSRICGKLCFYRSSPSMKIESCRTTPISFRFPRDSDLYRSTMKSTSKLDLILIKFAWYVAFFINV